MPSSSQKITSSTDSNCALVIMAKAPRAGAVKTRLAQNLPTAAVLDLYCCLLEDTLALAKSLDGVEIAIMCPACDVDDLSRTAGDGVRVVAQAGEGLGAGLVSVFAHFPTADRRRTIALNSDSPHLPVSVLQTAFDALTSCDLVVGPTYDGGYYLVGATASYPGLFTGSGMGTANALEELLARARALRLSVRFTDPFYDIDVAADLSRLTDDLRLAPERAPRTAAWLVQWEGKVASHRSRIGGA
jgi:rSAM/selenodomain-associated transferase 1